MTRIRGGGGTVEPTVELDYRRGAEVEVSLLWHRHTNQLSVTVRDNGTGEVLEIPVAADRALHAFRHPYAYATSIGVGYASTAALTPRADVVD
jgi:hypothetical protein